MLRAGPGRQIGSPLPGQFQREVWPQTVDLSEVHAKDRMEGRAGIKRQCIGLAGSAPDGKQACSRGGRVLLQPRQDSLNLFVAGCHLRLIHVIEFERLGQGEDVRLPVVANQRLAHRLHGRMLPSHLLMVRSGDGEPARHFRAQINSASG